MIQSMINRLKEIDKPVIKIMKYGFNFSLFVCMISAIILIIYDTTYHSPDLYSIGIQTFKTGLIFLVEFVICGVAMDTIKKEMT